MKRKSPNKKPPGQRQLRVGEEIRHQLSEILREASFRDPDLAAPELITITAVETGPDLAHAHVYVMPLGGKNAETIVAALNRAANYLRGELARRIDMRYTPKISFKYDMSFDEHARIDGLLRKTRDEQSEE